MTAFDRWDVVTALFPFTDAPVKKKPRPVLVLSNGSFNSEHGHLIACMITTARHSRWPSDHGIANLTLAGLSHASVVRWKVFTLPLHLLGRKIGTLGETDRAGIAAAMARIML
jgi:mRNA-degrading endonuclease toxin of MazEF toxin-antitoxin module